MTSKGRANLWRRFRRQWLLVFGYVLLIVSGTLVFWAPSPTLVRVLAEAYLVYAWGGFCLIGGALALIGVLFGRIDSEALGLPLGSAACLSWSASLVLQALQNDSATPLTAACMAASFAGVMGQRWVDTIVLLRGDVDD